MAPDHKHAAQTEGTAAAPIYLHDHAEEFGAYRGRMFVIGLSAGAQLAACSGQSWTVKSFESAWNEPSQPAVYRLWEMRHLAVGCNQELGQKRKVNDSSGCRKEEKILWRLFCFFRFRLDNQDEDRHANWSITSASYRVPDVRGQVVGRFGAVCT